MTVLPFGIALFLLAQAFFSGSEMGMVSANRVQLQARSDDGHAGATLALELIENEHRLLSTCLIGTNLCVVSGTTLFTLLVVRLGLNPQWALLYAPLVVLAEAVSKTAFRHHANALAPHLAVALDWAAWAFRPLLAVVGLWGRWLRRAIGGEDQGVTREDIVHYLTEREAQIDPQEHRMIRKVFELPDVTLEDCMTPLVDVHALPDTATVRQAVDLAIRCNHSRIPLYNDRIDNITGYVTIQDLLFAVEDSAPVGDSLRPVPFVPETKSADDMLHEMRRDRSHFAVVVDEYGGGVGVVTIEDILEEFVGEIRDERDAVGPSIQRLADRTWRVNARVEIEELAAAIEHTVPEGDYETVAGLILAHIGRIPEVGWVTQIEHLTFRVEEATDRAILTVRLTVD